VHRQADDSNHQGIVSKVLSENGWLTYLDSTSLCLVASDFQVTWWRCSVSVILACTSKLRTLPLSTGECLPPMRYEVHANSQAVRRILCPVVLYFGTRASKLAVSTIVVPSAWLVTQGSTGIYTEMPTGQKEIRCQAADVLEGASEETGYRAERPLQLNPYRLRSLVPTVAQESCRSGWSLGRCLHHPSPPG
jgi:hypothetical protein